MSTKILPLNVNIPLIVNVIDNEDQPVPITSGQVVRVALGRTDGSERFALYTASEGHADADWAGAVVAVDVLAVDTDPIRCLKLAVEIDIDGRKFRGIHQLETTRILIP